MHYYMRHLCRCINIENFVPKWESAALNLSPELSFLLKCKITWIYKATLFIYGLI
jgi:hypothetical protein